MYLISFSAFVVIELRELYTLSDMNCTYFLMQGGDLWCRRRGSHMKTACLSCEECCLPTCKQFNCSLEDGWTPWSAVENDIGGVLSIS